MFAGPYLAFGIAGNYKDEYSATGLPAGVTLESLGLTNSTTDLKYGTDVDSDLKPTDFGFNIGAGIQMSNFMISAQYGLGLTNIDTSTSNDNEKKNKVIGITAGFLFGGK